MDRTQKRTDRQQLAENIKKKTEGASALNDVTTSHRCAVITRRTKQTFISSSKSGSYFFVPHLRVELYHKNSRSSTAQWSPNTQYVLCESPRNRSNTERNVVTASAIYLCSSCTQKSPSFYSSTSTRPSLTIWFTSLYMSQTLPYTVSLTFWSLRLNLCTTCFNIQTFCVLPATHLCVLCGSENKQRLFPYTALTDWFL